MRRARTRNGRFAAGHRATGVDHARAGAGQRPRRRIADAGVRTGNDDGAIRQIEPATTSSAVVREPNRCLPFAVFDIGWSPIKTALHCEGASRSRTANRDACRRTDRVHATYAVVLRSARLRPVSAGDLPNGSVRPLAAHRRVATRARHHRRAIRSKLGDQGPAAAYNAAAKFYASIACLWIRRPICASRTSPTIESTRPRPIRTPGCRESAAQTRHARRARRAGKRPSRHADRPQSARDAGTRCAGGARCVPRTEGRRRTARSELPRLPSIGQPGFTPSRANGIPTVVMGCHMTSSNTSASRDSSSATFRSAIPPESRSTKTSQRDTLARALALFDWAAGPRTTRSHRKHGASDARWKDDYLNVNAMPAGRTRAASRRVRATEAVGTTDRDANAMTTLPRTCVRDGADRDAQARAARHAAARHRRRLRAAARRGVRDLRQRLRAVRGALRTPCR